MRNLEAINKVLEIARLRKKFIPLSDSVYARLEAINNYRRHLDAFGISRIKQETLNKFSLDSNPNFAVYHRLIKIKDAVLNNPEAQFFEIAELELLSLDSTQELVEILENNAPDEF